MATELQKRAGIGRITHVHPAQRSAAKPQEEPARAQPEVAEEVPSTPSDAGHTGEPDSSPSLTERVRRAFSSDAE